MKKVHRETEQILLAHEKQAFNDLKQAYARALADIKKKIKVLTIEIEMMEKADIENKTMIRSKVYQLQYQKSLEKQIDDAMKVLNDSTITTTDLFLKQMYEDGYITQFYVINNLGIPVIAPIDINKLSKAVNYKIEDMKFSKRMYNDVQELGKAVKEEIARGIASGMSYGDMALNIANRSEATLRKAYTIARTEGGRVSSMAKVDAQKAAKENGADIVKQWDSTLDNKTRRQHRILDGQIREIEEDFEYNGMKAKAPRMFGVPHMDINCRCISLTIPRWDIDETVTKRDGLKDTLIEAKNYADWKEKYYGIIEDYVKKGKENEN